MGRLSSRALESESSVDGLEFNLILTRNLVLQRQVLLFHSWPKLIGWMFNSVTDKVRQVTRK